MITLSGTLSKAWMHQALGVAFDRDYYFDPAKRHAIDDQCNAYATREFPGMGLFYSEANLGRLRYWDNSQVLIGGIQPNMILGLLLGADFVPADDRDADITPGCLAGRDPADFPPPESLLDHNLVTQFDEQIAQVQSGQGQPLRPIPPLFWDASGRAAIHGVLTSAQKLIGEAVFLDMMTEPKRCMQIMEWIADAYVVLCRHFARSADMPITDVHVGECSCCMVGPELVERFTVPVTSRIGQALGPVRLHSCGPSTHLLKAFAQIENLGALDLGGETSISKAREIFGPQMPISIAPLPCDMSAESTTPILDWARKILADNDGGNLEYVYHLESGYNLDTIIALTDFLRHQPDFEAMG
jgi:Uroporphyrinogen decarboxylase (URO-D)